MVYSLVVRARGLEYGGREFESRSLHLKPETKLREERGLSGCRKGLKTVPLAQALLSLKPAKTTTNNCLSHSESRMRTSTVSPSIKTMCHFLTSVEGVSARPQGQGVKVEKTVSQQYQNSTSELWDCCSMLFNPVRIPGKLVLKIQVI